MKKLILSAFILTLIGCKTAPKYNSEFKSELAFQVIQNSDYDEYELKDLKIRIFVRYEKEKLFLKIKNESDIELSYLPLDVKLGAENSHCSISEIYEDSPVKNKPSEEIDFGVKYFIANNESKLFYYDFKCEESISEYLTINGLQQGEKRLVLNFRFTLPN